MVVDSKGLFDTMTTLLYLKKIRLKKTVPGICNFFDSDTTDLLWWVQKEACFMDSLKNFNLAMQRALEQMMVNIIFNIWSIRALNEIITCENKAQSKQVYLT